MTILCVARAVEKKGLDVLLEALALLPDGLHWRFVHVGGGALVPALQPGRAPGHRRPRRLARCRHAGGRAGGLARAPICSAWRPASPRDGDRDGVPNVLMEAMSQELPWWRATSAAIPELVVPGVTGRLVPPEDPDALAARWSS